MARLGTIAAGYVLGFFGLVSTVYNGRTILEVSDLCKSGFGQLP